MGNLLSLSKTKAILCLEASEWALLIFAVVVVVGLIGEHRLQWWQRWYEAFAIAVVVGCGGELIADGGIFLFSSALQTIVDSEVAALNDKAGKANEAAEEARERAAKAELELAKLKTPRSLIDIPQLTSDLGLFKGTEYAFSSVFQDSESMDLLKAIDSLLQQAGWKKVKGPGGFPAVNVYGKEDGFAVPIGFSSGVQASVDSSESLIALQSLSVEKLPPPVRAAAVLTLGLGSHISPQSPDNTRPVDVQSGSGASKTVRIAVGKKP